MMSNRRHESLTASDTPETFVWPEPLQDIAKTLKWQPEAVELHCTTDATGRFMTVVVWLDQGCVEMRVLPSADKAIVTYPSYDPREQGKLETPVSKLMLPITSIVLNRRLTGDIHDSDVEDNMSPIDPRIFDIREASSSSQDNHDSQIHYADVYDDPEEERPICIAITETTDVDNIRHYMVEVVVSDIDGQYVASTNMRLQYSLDRDGLIEGQSVDFMAEWSESSMDDLASASREERMTRDLDQVSSFAWLETVIRRYTEKLIREHPIPEGPPERADRL